MTRVDFRPIARRDWFCYFYLDVLQRQLDLDAMILARQRSENRYSSAWRRLVGVAGIPLTPPTPLIGDVEAAIPDYRWDEVLTRLLTNSPELSAARLAVDRASFVLARAQVEPFPNLDVRAGVQHDNNSSGLLLTDSLQASGRRCPANFHWSGRRASRRNHVSGFFG